MFLLGFFAFLCSLTIPENYMWYRLGQFILQYRIALLVLLLALTGFMGYHASKVQLSYDFTRAIPLDNPKYKAYQEFRKKFGDDGNLLVLGVQTDQFFNEKKLIYEK